MADYYAVLKRTLSGFGEPSESLRHKIYEKARVTIARQLDATQPPLPDETKTAQLAQLDDAIKRMELEYGGPPADDFEGDPPPLPLGGGAVEEPGVESAPAEAQPDPVPVAAPAAEPVPEIVADPETADEAEVVAPAGSTHEPEETAEPLSADPEPVPPTEELVVEGEPAAEPLVAPIFEEPSRPDVFEGEAAEPDAPENDPLADAFAAIEAARTAGPPPSQPAGPNEIAFDDDAFAAAAERERDPSAADFGEPIVSPPLEEREEVQGTGDFDDRRVAERDAAALAPAPVSVPRSDRSGPGVLWFLLLVAALGLLFVFRAPLLAAVGASPGAIDRFIAGVPVVGPYLVGEVDDPDDPTRPKPVPTIRITPQPEVVEPDRDEGKLEQRLGPDGQEVDPAAGREDVGTLPPPSVPAPVVPQAPSVDDTDTRVVPIERGEPAPAADPPAEIAVTQPQPLPDPTPAPEATAAPEATPAPVAIAQTAVLYEEGSGGRETRSDRGAVVWSIVQESPGNGEPAEPAIRAELDVPERELKAIITIRRNTDKALAASHLMEVNFQPAPGFSGQNIDEVLSVRMKRDEQGQGSPLSVIPAKIAPGYFYIALDNLPSARERNVQLLRSSKYVDIPVEYLTGRRALVSLEKGVVGERVFSEALAAWDAQAQ